MIHIENILCEDYFRVECFDKDGNLKWADTIANLVVNVGLNDALDKYFKGSTYTASHFVGLTTATPTVAAADTMASHAGWTESVVYSNATRPAYTQRVEASIIQPVKPASQSIQAAQLAAHF